MRLPRAKFYNAVVKDFYESFKELIWKPQKGLVSLASTVVKISHQKLVCVCVGVVRMKGGYKFNRMEIIISIAFAIICIARNQIVVWATAAARRHTNIGILLMTWHVNCREICELRYAS